MSIEALNWALEHIQDVTMPTNTRFVLLILANRADPEGECFPSSRYIMERTGLSINTVRSACQEIAKRELMTITPRTRDNGSKTSNRYALCITRGKSLCITDPPPPTIGGALPHRVPEGPPPGTGPETKEDTPLPKGGEGAPAKSKRRKAGTPVPDGFAVSQRVREWALMSQILPTYVQSCCEAMVSHAKAIDWRRVDWDETLMGWVRKEMKLHPREPAKLTLEQRQCRWTNRGAEPRCRETGTVDMGNSEYLCATHHTAFEKRQRADSDQAQMRSTP